MRGYFVVEARSRLIIYGDIATGTVASGEELRVPLNGSFAVTVPIEAIAPMEAHAPLVTVAPMVAELTTSSGG